MLRANFQCRSAFCYSSWCCVDRTSIRMSFRRQHIPIPSFFLFCLLLPLPLKVALQHTATHCNTLQHTATHCNTLQYIARLPRSFAFPRACTHSLLQAFNFTSESVQGITYDFSLTCDLSADRGDGTESFAERVSGEIHVLAIRRIHRCDVTHLYVSRCGW